MLRNLSRYNVPMSNKNIKVAVGLSGGVDSAVSAYLLKSQGYEVAGVHMQCWDYSSETCKGNEDRSDAVAICEQLGIKFKFLNFEKEYKSRVIDYFYSEYRAGRTPNPDVLCNKEIKFGLFLDWAMREGFDYVATGHYARILSRHPACRRSARAGPPLPAHPLQSAAGGVIDNQWNNNSNSFALLKGVDEGKDQSYFLYRLSQNQLSKSLFPIGGITKNAVRKVAKEQKLVVAEKAESMGICFVGEVNINKFLKKEIAPKAGEVVLKSSGEAIGRHEGVWFHTIGQRHGFEITKYVGLPLYVVGKDVERNRLIVGFYNDCLRDTFKTLDNHFMSSGFVEANRQGFACDVRIRHLGQLYRAQVTLSNDDTASIKLEQPAFGVAPGQSAVFYEGDKVLGGGVIY